jgi:serine/threonine-protein kinase
MLGGGGMGEVYKARDTRLNRTVALKVLPDQWTASSDLRRRLAREAQSISQLNHPHICTLYDIGAHGDVSFLVMEHLEGETLASRLDRGPIPLPDVLKYAMQIADALATAHAQGIIHRDLKPGNIMLVRSGIKVLDFGLAKQTASAEREAAHHGATATEPITAEGTLVGTVQYMAPEQLEGTDADARSDLFAFGCVLYEMVTGRRAFPGESQASIIAAILDREPRPMFDAAPDAHPAMRGLERIVRRCLVKKPEERWQSARDVEEVLHWVAEGEPAASGRPTAARTQTALRLAAAAFAGAVVGAAVLWAGLQSRAPSPAVVRLTLPVQGNALGFGGALGSRLAIAPDGSRLVYVAEEQRAGKAYVRPLDSHDVPLESTVGATSVFLSPDGEWLGFFGGGKLKKTRLAGGPAATICDAIEGVGATWTAADTIVFAPSPVSALAQVPSVGGTPQPVTKLENGETSHRWPSMLPDGETILFAAARGADFTSSRIFMQSLRTGARTEIVEGTYPRYSPTGHILFARDATLFALPFDARRLQATGSAAPVITDLAMNPTTGAALFAFSENGVLVYRPRGSDTSRRALLWVDRTGLEANVAPSERRAFLQPRLSPDGRRIAVTIGETGTERDLWLYDLQRRTMTRMTVEAGEDETPVWNGDGSRIAFSAARTGQPRSIFVMPPSDPAGLRKVGSTRYITHLGAWAPDGRALAWTDFDPAAGGDIRVLRMDGSGTVRDFVTGPFDQRGPAFSPDGRWIAYTSNETGRDEVYVQPYPGPGAKVQISTAGGSQPVWSRDGTELFYRGERQLMTVAVRLSPAFTVGERQPLFADTYDIEHRDDRNYDVSADGKRFLMVRVERPSSSAQLAVVLNWFTELRRGRS